MRKSLSQLSEHCRVGCANYCSDIGIAVLADSLSSPLLAHISHGLVDRAAVCQLHILELTAGRVRGLYQDIDALVTAAAHLQKRINAVCTKVAVYCESVSAERLHLVLADRYCAQVSAGVGVHCCADVVALSVSYNEHTVELCITDSLLKSSDAVVTVHLIVCSLGLDSRNDVVDLVDDSLVESVDSLCSGLQGPAVVLKIAALDM